MNLNLLPSPTNDFEFEKALRFVDATVLAKTKKHLKDVQVIVLLGALQGFTYDEIAEKYSYSAKYLKQDIGPKFWKLLSEVLGEEVSKTSFRVALKRHFYSLDKTP